MLRKEILIFNRFKQKWVIYCDTRMKDNVVVVQKWLVFDAHTQSPNLSLVTCNGPSVADLVPLNNVTLRPWLLRFSTVQYSPLTHCAVVPWH